MSQRIVTECDECLEAGEATDAETVTLSTLGVEVEVDLCERHKHPLAELLARFVALGRAPGAPSYGQSECPRCGRRFNSPQALGKHAKQVHGESVNVLRGRASPKPAEPAAVAPGQVVCPECGRSFGTNQGLAVHRNRSHGVAGESKATESRRGSREPPEPVEPGVEPPGGESRP